MRNEVGNLESLEFLFTVNLPTLKVRGETQIYMGWI